MPKRTLRDTINFLFIKTVFNGKPHTDKDLSSMYVIRNKRESKYKCKKSSDRSHGWNKSLLTSLCQRSRKLSGFGKEGPGEIS
jgi:hypothetical protein